MRFGFLAPVALAALVAAAPAAFAFEIQPLSNNAQASANFSSNPDRQSDGMSANLAGNNGGSSAFHFGGTTLQFNGGNGGANDYGTSPAYREQFMGGPGQIGSAISPR